MMEHATDAIETPLRDVNLARDPIPEKLLAVQDDAYSLVGLSSCGEIDRELAELTRLLGPDVNQYQRPDRTEARERGVAEVAGALIGGLIPFRGVLREVTGANAAERRYLAAIAAGNARRSFLKGFATAHGCILPPPSLELRIAYDFRGF